MAKALGLLSRRGYGSPPHILDTHTPMQIALFVEVESEAYADELTAQANINTVAAVTGFSGKDDALRSLIARLQGTDSMQVGGADLQHRLEGFLSKKRRDT